MTRTRANLVLLLVALIWGSAFVAQSLGMAGMGPLSFTGVRFALGAAVIAPLALREWRGLHRAGRPPGWPEAGRIALLGGLLFLGAAMQQIGMLNTSVTNAGFLTALYVPLVPLLAWALFAQAPHWSVGPASLGCVAGTWLLTGAGRDGPSLTIGDWWVIGSSLPWAFHVLLVGRAAEKLQGAMIVATGQFLVCSALSLAAGLATEPQSVAGFRTALGAILYTGVISVGIGFTLQVVGQRHARPADAAIVLSAETMFAALFGALIMGDRLGAIGLAGCALILAGVAMVQLQPLLAAQRQRT